MDNLGRYNYGFIFGENKGIWGDVFAAAALRPNPWKMQDPKDKEFSRRMIPRTMQCLANDLAKLPMRVAETSFTLTRPMPVHVRFEGLKYTTALFFNDRMMGFYPAMQGGYGEALLSGEVRKGINRVRLYIWGDVQEKQLGPAFHFYRLEENLTADSTWQFRPWLTTVPATEKAPSAPKGLPAWFRASFTAKGDEEPLFLKIAGAYKGQIFLNGHNAGRFWSIGPQQYYYLPSAWLKHRNELLIFSENGAPPTGSRLEIRPQGPYGKP